MDMDQRTTSGGKVEIIASLNQPSETTPDFHGCHDDMMHVSHDGTKMFQQEFQTLVDILFGNKTGVVLLVRAWVLGSVLGIFP